ncbi:MAG: GtrA family protein [Hungatella sp.]|jgi:putative flippase GtrA|nr:GtrA family protein [Hungatella sp.]
MISNIWGSLRSRESVTYIICGVLTTAVDWITHRILWHMGAEYQVSTAVSWAAAVLFAFVSNKFWVFQSFEVKPKQMWKEFVSFAACRVATFLITMAGMIIMVGMLHWNEFFGKLIVSGASMVLNYIPSKLFIFKKTGDGRSRDGE